MPESASVSAQPAIELFGLKIQEPVTSLTDLVVAAVCFFAAYRLHRSGNPARSVVYFKYFFITMGISTTLGGLIGHAFLYAFGFAWKIPGWITGMCSVAFMERAAIMQGRSIMKPRISNFFAWMNVIELSAFIIVVFYTLNFFYVEVHAAYGLLVVFLFEFFIHRKYRDKASRYIIFGVILSALAAFIHLGRISPHVWFNYFDLSHIFMAGGAYLFYKGAEQISKTENKTIS